MELNRLEEALESSKKSVSLDAENMDIRKLHLEIECRHQSQLEEEQLQALSPSEREKLQVIDEFLQKARMSDLTPLDDDDLLQLLKSCTEECTNNLMAQVHFRLSGALSAAVDWWLRSPHDKIAPELLRLISSAIDKQQLSISFMDNRGLPFALMELVIASKSPSRDNAQGLEVLCRCCSPAAPMNLKAAILNNSFLLNAVCTLLQMSAASCQQLGEMVSLLGPFLSFLRLSVFSDEGRCAVEKCSELVFSLALLLYAQSYSPLWGEIIAILVGCSQLVKLRESFLTPVANGLTPLVILLKKIREIPDEACNCLAILINLTSESSETARVEILKNGGFEIATSVLNTLNPLVDFSETYALRCYHLLSRIAVLKEIQNKLYNASYYSVICRGIKDTAKYVYHDGPSFEMQKCGYLINIMASLNSPSQECRAVANNLCLVKHLLAIFPEPRQDLGVITPESVVQVPKKSAPLILMGNTARCLMPFADDPVSFQDIYTNRILMGIEKLVCSMATCTDIRVRKNIAILLAKGCRDPSVRQRVSELRGIQMMVELQDRLL